MPLKNYTTEVPALKSIGQIQGNLVAHGASNINVHYGTDREPDGLIFTILTPQGEVPFHLPANREAVKKLLTKSTDSNYKRWDDEYQKQRAQKLHEQASRVVWRILKDWVDAQLAIIETEMVTLEQVFLPYMEVKNGRTLFEVMVEKRFLLTEGRSQ